MRPLAIVLTALSALGAAAPAPQDAAGSRPSILLAIADDWSAPHAGAYGDGALRTPVVDRLAREGARFTRAFVASPSCTPSRGALLAGQAVHRLQDGANLWSRLPAAIPVYPDLLERQGYIVGYSRKGWGPGSLDGSGRTRNPAGPSFESFEAFLATVPAGRPFVYWFGSQDPHRPYTPGSGKAAGLDPSRVRVPAYWPDTPEVREDVLDYYAEVERFDREVGDHLRLLETRGLLDRTLVIVTSDNGMPFPRAKANLYDAGTRVPLVLRWPARVPAGRAIDAFASLTDLAPTILEAAGLEPPAVMTGRSLWPVLEGRDDPRRDRAFVERERHANVRAGNLSYPMRAVRTATHLYVRNLRPDRWPAGDPEVWFAVGPYGDVDDSPTKRRILAERDAPDGRRHYELSFAKRPAEELYALDGDPDQVENLAGRPGAAGVQAALRASLDRWMAETGDPRAADPKDDRWDLTAYFGGPAPGVKAGRP